MTMKRARKVCAAMCRLEMRRIRVREFIRSEAAKGIRFTGKAARIAGQVN